MKLYSLVPGSGADHRAWLATSPLTVPRESACTLVRLRKKKRRRKKEEQPWQSAGAGGDMRSTFWCVRWRRSLSEWSSWALTHPVVCGTAENDLLVCVNSKQKYARGVPQSLVNKKWRFTSHCCLGLKKKKKTRWKPSSVWENLGCKQFNVYWHLFLTMCILDKCNQQEWGIFWHGYKVKSLWNCQKTCHTQKMYFEILLKLTTGIIFHGYKIPQQCLMCYLWQQMRAKPNESTMTIFSFGLHFQNHINIKTIQYCEWLWFRLDDTVKHFPSVSVKPIGQSTGKLTSDFVIKHLIKKVHYSQKFMTLF